MSGQSEYLYVNYKKRANESPAQLYLFPMQRPLGIKADCNISIHQIYVSCPEAPTGPLMLHIDGAGADAIVHRDDRPQHAFACLIPEQNKVIPDVRMLPLAAGNYDYFAITIRDLNENMVSFDRLIFTMKIKRTN